MVKLKNLPEEEGPPVHKLCQARRQTTLDFPMLTIASTLQYDCHDRKPCQKASPRQKLGPGKEGAYMSLSPGVHRCETDISLTAISSFSSSSKPSSNRANTTSSGVRKFRWRSRVERAVMTKGSCSRHILISSICVNRFEGPLNSGL